MVKIKLLCDQWYGSSGTTDKKTPSKQLQSHSDWYTIWEYHHTHSSYHAVLSS